MSRDTEEYTIQPVEAGDTERVLDLLKKTFYIDEPMNQAVGLCDESSPCHELNDYCVDSLLKGLSFKAVDPRGNIVGVTISAISELTKDDATNLLNKAEQCKNEKFQKILYVLVQREDGTRLWEKYPNTQQLVDVKVAATDANWRKRGIMNQLVETTENATKKLGLRLLRMDTSSAYSAKSAERLGFTCIYAKPYKKITKDGQPIVVPEPPHTLDQVFIKEL